MSAELMQALNAVAQRLVAAAAQDAELRSGLRALALALLSATEELAGGLSTEPAPQAQPAALGVPVELAAEGTASAVEPLGRGGLVGPASAPEVTPLPAAPLSREAPHREPPPAPAPSRWPPSPVSDADLPLLEARCRLKAKGARWAATRRRRLAEGADFRTEIDPLDREMIARAKELPDCFLWMNHPSGPSPEDLTALEELAGCFEALANAIGLVRSVLADVEDHPELFEQALDLAAEAQSALRVSIASIDGGPDNDQVKAFIWLKTTAGERRLFIERYMRADDPADPTAWSNLDARINALSGRLEEARARERQRKKLFGKLRYLVKSLPAEDEKSLAEGWERVAATVDALIQGGLPPSNRDIREVLLPVLEGMPELSDLPEGFGRALREIDRYLESRPAVSDLGVPAEPAAEVREAARLLGGKSLVLIGGGRRPHALEALKEAFGLRELFWIETREHQSVERFEPHVARPDVAVVLLAIRWSSHSFGEVKQFCDRHGKPLVRLPGGYNPNAVARQLLAQCSARLETSAGRDGD
jgi:hypothetical protein